MPIEIGENLITVDFDGSGDICVAPIKNEFYCGLIMIEDEPGIIGETTDKYRGKNMYSIDNNKVFLNFYSPDSIDLLIEDLIKLKNIISTEY